MRTIAFFYSAMESKRVGQERAETVQEGCRNQYRKRE